METEHSVSQAPVEQDIHRETSDKKHKEFAQSYDNSTRKIATSSFFPNDVTNEYLSKDTSQLLPTEYKPFLNTDPLLSGVAQDRPYTTSSSEINEVSQINSVPFCKTRKAHDIITTSGPSAISTSTSTVIPCGTESSDFFKSYETQGKLDLTKALHIRDVTAYMELARGIHPELDSDRLQHLLQDSSCSDTTGFTSWDDISALQERCRYLETRLNDEKTHGNSLRAEFKAICLKTEQTQEENFKLEALLRKTIAQEERHIVRLEEDVYNTCNQLKSEIQRNEELSIALRKTKQRNTQLELAMKNCGKKMAAAFSAVVKKQDECSDLSIKNKLYEKKHRNLSHNSNEALCHKVSHRRLKDNTKQTNISQRHMSILSDNDSSSHQFNKYVHSDESGDDSSPSKVLSSGFRHKLFGLPPEIASKIVKGISLVIELLLIDNKHPNLSNNNTEDQIHHSEFLQDHTMTVSSHQRDNNTESSSLCPDIMRSNDQLIKRQSSFQEVNNNTSQSPIPHKYLASHHDALSITHLPANLNNNYLSTQTISTTKEDTLLSASDIATVLEDLGIQIPSELTLPVVNTTDQSNTRFRPHTSSIPISDELLLQQTNNFDSSSPSFSPCHVNLNPRYQEIYHRPLSDSHPIDHVMSSKQDPIYPQPFMLNKKGQIHGRLNHFSVEPTSDSFIQSLTQRLRSLQLNVACIEHRTQEQVCQQQQQQQHTSSIKQQVTNTDSSDYVSRHSIDHSNDLSVLNKKKTTKLKPVLSDVTTEEKNNNQLCLSQKKNVPYRSQHIQSLLTSHGNTPHCLPLHFSSVNESYDTEHVFPKHNLCKTEFSVNSFANPTYISTSLAALNARRRLDSTNELYRHKHSVKPSTTLCHYSMSHHNDLFKQHKAFTSKQSSQHDCVGHSFESQSNHSSRQAQQPFLIHDKRFPYHPGLHPPHGTYTKVIAEKQGNHLLHSSSFKKQFKTNKMNIPRNDSQSTTQQSSHLDNHIVNESKNYMIENNLLPQSKSQIVNSQNSYSKKYRFSLDGKRCMSQNNDNG